MRDLLRRVQRALPQVVQWIDDLQAKHLRQSVPVSAMAFQRLAGWFPAAVLEGARAVTVDTIPFPPVSAFDLPEFESLANMPMAGITFRNMYFVHRAQASEAIHFHELVHVVQWNTLGVMEFLLTYAVGIAQSGYMQSPLEAMAFDLQARFEQQTGLPAIIDVVAGHAVATRDAAAMVFRAHGLVPHPAVWTPD